LAKTFEDSRAATVEYIRTTNDDLRDHFFDHPVFDHPVFDHPDLEPVFGTMGGHQCLLLISAQGARHTAQIEEVKAGSNFPKNQKPVK
jgi:hypothetical protein